MALAQLTASQRREVQIRAGHVRELLTGFRSGRAELAGEGEPDPRFAAEVALKERYAAKAADLGVTVRTLERWVSAYRSAARLALLLSGSALRRWSTRAGTRRPGWCWRIW